MASCLVPTSVLHAAVSSAGKKRSISFFNTHTEEHLTVCYFQGGVYSSKAMKQINHILRDHRTETIESIDPRLIDMLFSINRRLNCTGPFHIISGYRSPETNTDLVKKSSGVAKSSYHMQGKAIDIRLPDCDLRRLHKVCVELKAGGVGYYPRSDFVHVDTGAFRTWNG
ncbi:DUF882 domain-containing protein [Desulfosarcina sp. OttesenSCG-928-G10]|nr:DUF882 domain-containing protein [Desulfosarcina sp. OttesenSCG-928-G10]